MAQSGFTPILLYASGTASAAPTAGNLTSSASGAELALNYADGKLFYKDSGGNVQTLASKATGSIGGSDTQVQYNSSGALAGSANLTFNGTTLTANTAAVSTGNLTFSGTAQRITGDFSNATHANRVAFQTSATNGATSPFLLPNGTGNTTQWVMASASDPTNSSYLGVGLIAATDARINSDKLGTGTYLPMTFYTGGSERVRVDTSGNVLIGTTTPSGTSRLYIDSTEARIQSRNSTSGANGYVGAVNPNEWRVWTTVTTDLTLGTNNTERMRIDSSGNVGIGTASPGQALSVARGAGVPAYATFAGNASADPLLVGEDAAGLARLYTGSTTPISFWTSATERMRIDSSGNVGIGTASPGAKLDVQGNVSGGGVNGRALNNDAGASSSAGFTVSTGGGVSAALFAFGTSAAYVGVSSSHPLAFQTNNTERMRIDSSGNVGIGTASPGAILHTVKTSAGAATVATFLQNSDNTTSTEVRMAFAANNAPLASDRYGWIGYVNTGGTNGGALTFATTPGGTAATERMRIDSSGNIVAGASAALATTATDGFLYVPTCAGTPTGTPTAITGMAPIVVNTTNNKLYFYSGGAWRDAGP